ncbi:hypothetical protein B0H11DRAFT_2435299 [Mycena galericulata]|nr:hypothetical protein B0H11DRAFT_2435299 [Mycena galericulata]
MPAGNRTLDSITTMMKERCTKLIIEALRSNSTSQKPEEPEEMEGYNTAMCIDVRGLPYSIVRGSLKPDTATRRLTFIMSDTFQKGRHMGLIVFQLRHIAKHEPSPDEALRLLRTHDYQLVGRIPSSDKFSDLGGIDGDEELSIFQEHVKVGLRANKIFEELSDEKELLVKTVSSLNMVRRKG